MGKRVGRRLFAGALSVLLPGLGHVVHGRALRGACWLALFWTGWIVLVWSRLFGVGFVSFAWAGAIADAVAIGPKKRGPFVPQSFAPDRRWRSLTLVAGVATTVLIATRGSCTHLYKAPSSSMAPTLFVGDHFVASSAPYWFGRPSRGDVVAFRNPCRPEDLWVKRVVGLEGDRIELRCGILYINDEPVQVEPSTERLVYWDYSVEELERWTQVECQLGLEHLGGSTHELCLDPRRDPKSARGFPDLEHGSPLFRCQNLGRPADESPRIEPSIVPPSRPCAPSRSYVVPDGHLFVLGDNRALSADSRLWGPVPEENVVGKVTRITVSFARGKMRWGRIAEDVN